MSSGGPTGPNTPGISLEQLNQYLGAIAQYMGRLIQDLENGTGLLLQPYNSLLTSIAALSTTLTTNNLIMGSGLGTVAKKTLAEVITANLGNGTNGQFLETNGAGVFAWADAVTNVKLQTFAAGGTYTPSTGTVASLLGAVGGGAGGGGCANSSAANQGSAAGGGGGSTSLALKTAAQIGASQTVTVGGTANGGAAGNNNGTNGNDSSIGALCIGKGGSLGLGAAADVGTPNGGAGGVAGTGDINIPGQAGSGSMSASINTVNGLIGGMGGSSGLGFGAGAAFKVSQSTGGAGGLYGGGGGGGISRNANGAAGGGAGAQGFCFALDFTKV